MQSLIEKSQESHVQPRRGSDAGVRAASLLARAQLPPGQGNVALVNLWRPGGSMQSMLETKFLQAPCVFINLKCCT